MNLSDKLSTLLTPIIVAVPPRLIAGGLKMHNRVYNVKKCTCVQTKPLELVSRPHYGTYTMNPFYLSLSERLPKITGHVPVCPRRTSQLFFFRLL